MPHAASRCRFVLRLQRFGFYDAFLQCFSGAVHRGGHRGAESGEYRGRHGALRGEALLLFSGILIRHMMMPCRLVLHDLTAAVALDRVCNDAGRPVGNGPGLLERFMQLRGRTPTPM